MMRFIWGSACLLPCTTMRARVFSTISDRMYLAGGMLQPIRRGNFISGAVLEQGWPCGPSGSPYTLGGAVNGLPATPGGGCWGRAAGLLIAMLQTGQNRQMVAVSLNPA